MNQSDKIMRGEGSISPSGKKHKALARIAGRNTYLGTYATYEAALAAIRARRSIDVPTPVPVSERMDEPTSEQRNDTVMTLKAWGRTWLQRRAQEKRRSHADTVSIWKKCIVFTPFVDWPLTAIKPRDVQSWVRTFSTTPTKRTKRPPKDQSVKNTLNTLRGALRDAVLEGLISSNPCREVKVIRTPETKEAWTWLRKEEIDAIVALPDNTTERNAIVFLIHTGLRTGEAWCLSWTNVDLKSRTVLVATSHSGSAKSGRVRRVPLMQPAYDALIAQRKLTGHNRLVFPGAKGKRRAKSNHANLKRHLRAAGIVRHVRPHDLRHSCASGLVQGFFGRIWSLYEVSRLLGHSDITTTTRYAHLCDGGIERAMRETTLAAE